MDTKKKKRFAVLAKAETLLRELVSINKQQCSDEDLALTIEFIDVDELGLAIEEFCAMWRVTKKPKLGNRSIQIIAELAALWNHDPQLYYEQL